VGSFGGIYYNLLWRGWYGRMRWWLLCWEAITENYLSPSSFAVSDSNPFSGTAVAATAAAAFVFT